MVQRPSLKDFPPRGRELARLYCAFLVSFFLASSFVVLISVPAHAAAIQHGTLDLIAENAWITPGQNFTIGMHFKLDTGWHIYWKNPGDSGEPPRVTWQLPQGISAGEIEWPAPTRMLYSNIMNYVYDGEVTLLVPMRADQTVNVSTGTAKFDASVRLLICSKEMCVPSKAQLSLSVPVKAQASAADQRTASLFASARAQLPKAAPKDWQFTWTDRKDSVILHARTMQHIATAYFFPMEDSPIDYSAKQDFASVAQGFQITMRKGNQPEKYGPRLRGVLVLADGQAYLLDVPAGSAASGRTGS
jgi:DsbC/DsbD-like thiol-disulfide interchange protein